VAHGTGTYVHVHVHVHVHPRTREVFMARDARGAVRSWRLVYGSCVVVCGSCVGRVWVVCGSCVDRVWVVCGSCVGRRSSMTRSNWLRNGHRAVRAALYRKLNRVSRWCRSSQCPVLTWPPSSQRATAAGRSQIFECWGCTSSEPSC
jgi:hypothetical protein